MKKTIAIAAALLAWGLADAVHGQMAPAEPRYSLEQQEAVLRALSQSATTSTPEGVLKSCVTRAGTQTGTASEQAFKSLSAAEICARAWSGTDLFVDAAIDRFARDGSLALLHSSTVYAINAYYDLAYVLLWY